jgi:D-alanyl-D-alanine carboxypeptidase/D-alanyl-D-alanine-endopeptidase (penicillin-binding protein 4)
MRSTSSSKLPTLLLAATVWGCAANKPPALTPSSLSPFAALRADLSAVFNAPEFDRATWGVSVRSIDTGEAFFELNPKKLLLPASNMKILTLAAVADRLGWDYTFETRLMTAAPVEDGVLKGDLIVAGSGDPTIGGRAADVANGRLFDRWAEELLAAGIRTIDGRVIGDDNAFDDEGVEAGWLWDDLAFSYAAPVGALTYDSNAVELVVRPGAAAGDNADLSIRPADGGLAVENYVVTSPPGGDFSLNLRRGPGTTRLIARGAVPAGTPEFARTVSVDNPTEFFLTALHRTLAAHGITVTGPTLDIDALAVAPDLSNCRVLLSHRSAPLSALAAPMMKLSLNLYADTLLKSLGASGSPGTFQAGRQAEREVLQSWGIAPDDVVVSDGSGLSRYNSVTADTLVSVLQHVAREARHAAPFEATLPVAGQDGTLGSRMKGTAADGRARAKTGSMTGVRALSGYVRTKDGERLAFSVVINGTNLPAERVDNAADRAVGRLADFSRAVASDQ